MKRLLLFLWHHLVPNRIPYGFCGRCYRLFSDDKLVAGFGEGVPFDGWRCADCDVQDFCDANHLSSEATEILKGAG